MSHLFVLYLCFVSILAALCFCKLYTASNICLMKYMIHDDLTCFLNFDNMCLNTLSLKSILRNDKVRPISTFPSLSLLVILAEVFKSQFPTGLSNHVKLPEFSTPYCIAGSSEICVLVEVVSSVCVRILSLLNTDILYYLLSLSNFLALNPNQR